MNLIFASANALYPFCRGGAEITVHSLLNWLYVKGFDIRALGSTSTFLYNHELGIEYLAGRLNGEGVPFTWLERFVTLSSPNSYEINVSTERAFRYKYPYSCLLAERQTDVMAYLEKEVEVVRPDIILTHLSGSNAITQFALNHDIKVILLQPSFEMGSTHPHSLETLNEFGSQLTAVIVPSMFVYREVVEMFPTNCVVIPPMIDEIHFRSNSYPEKIRSRKYITLINAQPKKGLYCLLEMSKLLPGQQFIATESWFPTPWELRQLIDIYENVTLISASDKPEDMSKIYGQTKLLLAPSVCAEAFGRVVIEAQMGGIPVIATSIGALPEVVGKGGMILKPESSPEIWAQTVKQLTADTKAFQILSANAKANTKRFRQNDIGRLFESTLLEAVK